MKVKANISYAKISPRKLRLLCVGFRGQSPAEALLKLQFYSQEGTVFLVKLIKQGVANAVNNFKLQEKDLIIDKIEINEGPKLKRMDKSHGARFDRGLIQKRSSKLALILAEKEEKETEVKTEIKTKPEVESTKEVIKRNKK